MRHEHGALRRRFERGGLVLDGAMGTELERRGVATTLPLWSAAALTTRPQLISAIHRDYVVAGADILVANTFRTNARTLRIAGRFDQAADLNRRAVEIARREARRLESGAMQDGFPTSGVTRAPVLVAASVAPVEDCYHPERVPGETALVREHSRMMRWLKTAQPDLIWIETINTIREARAAARAAAEANMSFVVSFVPAESGNLLSGETLEEAVAAVEPFRPLAIGLNCIPPRGMTELLPRLRKATARPLAAYAHVDNANPIRGWSYGGIAEPERYADYARRWLDIGVSVVGGCCGTTPAHIRAVRETLRGLR